MGYVDNVVVVSWALLSVIRKAGLQIVTAHWDGSPRALSQLCAALRRGPFTSLAAQASDHRPDVEISSIDVDDTG